LISACNKYKGALLLVSHNRDFLKKCARQYLSVVPGHFDLYDDLKTAERATYTFIEEMESGGKVSGKEALVNNPGGGTVHSSQKVDANSPSKTETPSVSSSTESEATPTKIEEKPVKDDVSASETPKSTSVPENSTPDSKSNAPINPEIKANGPTTETFSVGEKIQAKYSQDGRWYNAVINNFKDEKYLVYYVQYGNSEYLPVSSIRKFVAPAAKNGQNNHINNNRPQQGQNRQTKNGTR